MSAPMTWARLASVVFVMLAPRAAIAQTQLGLGQTSADWSVATTGDIVHAAYWRQVATGNEELFYRRSQDRGETWEAEVQLTTAAGLSRSPTVGVSGASVYVVWADDRAGNFEIYFKMSLNNGTTWGTDARLTNIAGNSLGPSIAVSAGWVQLAWNDDRDGNLEIYHKRGALNGASWSPDTRVTNTATSSTHPALAVNGSAVHLVWEDDRQIYYQRSLDDAATWNAAQRVSHVPVGTYLNANLPSIAATSGDVYVVWMDNRVLSCIYCYRLYFVSSSSNGSTWGTEQEISSDESSTGYPSLTVLGTTLRVTWASRSEATGTSIYYLRSLDGGATWAPRATINEYATGNVDRPSHAVADGRVHIMWAKDAFDPTPTLRYTHLDEGGDLDVFNSRLDVSSNILRMRPTGAGSTQARLWVGQFVVVNTDASINPDPDGPSEAPVLDHVEARPRLTPRTAAQIQLDLQQCFALASLGAGPAFGPTVTVTPADLLRGTARIPALLVVPSTLNRGAPRRGEAFACVRTSMPNGTYEQTVSVSGRVGGVPTLDTFRVRLIKSLFVWPPF